MHLISICNNVRISIGIRLLNSDKIGKHCKKIDNNVIIAVDSILSKI